MFRTIRLLAFSILLSLVGLAGCEKKTINPDTPDTTPPEVVAIKPAQGSVTVAIGDSIVVMFSEPVEQKSAVHGLWVYVNDTVVVEGLVISIATDRVYFWPWYDFLQGVWYTVKLDSVRDLAGNMLASYEWKFRTIDPLRVKAVTPQDGATIPPALTPLIVEFSRSIAAIADTAFTVVDASSTPIPGTASIVGGKIVFTPSAPWQEGKTFTAKVAKGVKDTARGVLDTTFQWSFRTAALDRTPPSVLAVSPQNGATNVSRSAALAAIFSEPVAGVQFTLTPSVSGAVNVQGSTATFIPSSLFAWNTAYTASVTAADTSGNAMAVPYSWSFTTLPEPDTTPPSVVSTVPRSNATNVSRATKVEVVFSELITSGNLLLQKNGTSIPAAVSIQGNTITLVPNLPLLWGTEYRATVSDISDMAGNRLVSYSWSFTTLPEPDTTPPRVTSTVPANNATGVSSTVQIRATFSELVVPASVSFNLTKNGNAVAGNLQIGVSSFTFTPAEPLLWNTTYIATIASGLKDTAGNAMTVPYVWSFTVMADPTPRWVLGEGYGAIHLAVDDSGNVYLGGADNDSQPYRRSFVARFSASGKLQWLVDIAPGAVAGIAVNQGRVYVAQFGGGYLECRSTTTGKLIWSILVAEGGDDFGSGYSVNVAPDGFIYITLYGGRIAKVRDNGDSGELLWKRKVVPGSIQSVAFDAEGNIYVGGETPDNPVTHEDLYVTKFDRNFVPIWTEYYGTEATDYGGFIAVASAQNVVYQTGGGRLVIAYDTVTGEQLWPPNHGSEAYTFEGILVGRDGYAYAGGRKIAPNGVTVWQKQFYTVTFGGRGTPAVWHNTIFTPETTWTGSKINRYSTLTGEPLP